MAYSGRWSWRWRQRDSAGGLHLGPLIHNAHVIARLEEAGIFSVDQPEELPRGATVLIRAHGVARRVYEQLEERGAQVLDATCPFVEKIHRIVEQESRLGRDIVVIGSPQHPEVEGICGWCEHSAVFADEQQLQQALQEAPEKTNGLFLWWRRPQCAGKHGKNA